MNTKNRILEKATDNPSHGGLEIKSEFVRCDLCGSEDHEIVYAKIDPVTKWEFYLVRCSCGMAFVNPMPLGESLKLLYPGHYLDEKPGLDSLYQKMISILESVNVGNRLLDIGCGSGEFIRYANERGWDAHGVDFVDWATDKNNLKIRVGHLPSMSIPESSFDVVTAWAVMEHVRDPSSYFEKIGSLLRKQGKFVFTVPNVSSPGMIYSCDEDTPRHLWLFTPEAVAQYLKKYGMEVENVINDGSIYRAYSFGLIRRAFRRVIGKQNIHCESFKNRAVSLLENKPVDVYLYSWLKDVFKKLSYRDICIDTVDLAFGIIIGSISKMLKNYGVITVIARKK